MSYAATISDHLKNPSTHRAGRALAAAAAAVALLPSVASAATNGPIVFERSSGISSIAASGGLVTTLIAPSSNSFHPAVSPDGSRIAYAHNRDIYTMRRDGTDRRRLTLNAANNEAPTWSPDGRSIAYSGAPGGVRDIHVIPATGGITRALTATHDNPEYNPAWSPDGQQIAYNRGGCDIPKGGGTCVYVMNADGSAQTNLTPENRVPGCENSPGYYFNGASREPAWSPDSTKIAFSGPTTCKQTGGGSDIWLMGRAGGAKVNISFDNGTVDRQPDFSPDGTAIAYIRPSVGLFTMTANGTAKQQIHAGAFDYFPDWDVVRP